MIINIKNNLHGQELDYIELFAGVANVWGAVTRQGYKGARVDIEYHTPEPTTSKQNFMDILSSAGFATLA